jgi:hypothetical protein
VCVLGLIAVFAEGQSRTQNVERARSANKIAGERPFHCRRMIATGRFGCWNERDECLNRVEWSIDAVPIEQLRVARSEVATSFFRRDC